jgi:hypothetical protein
MMNKFWTIRIDDAELQWHTFAIQSKGECYLSPNTKLVGFDKGVQLSNEQLAMAFRDAVLTTLRRRHGESVLVTVTTFHTNRAEPDDSLVLARIKERVFSPNKKPSMSFEQKDHPFTR